MTWMTVWCLYLCPHLPCWADFMWKVSRQPKFSHYQFSLCKRMKSTNIVTCIVWLSCAGCFLFFSWIAAEHCNIRMMDKQLNSNTAGFKSKVVEFALEHGKCGAGIKFDVDWKCVWGWCNQRMHSGTKAAKSALSEASHGSFLNWNWKKSSHAVWWRCRTSATRWQWTMLRVKVQALSREESIPHEDFKASAGCAWWFL